MHDLSYRPKNVLINIFNCKISVEIFTFNNIYTADPDRTEYFNGGFISSGLLVSGGQENTASPRRYSDVDFSRRKP
jgi:hypothetical protein